MPPAFVYNPQRDAYRAIRGFYYQIELTLLRWLELGRTSVLVCECGEDIDHVSQLSGADFETQRRLLEQVKLRGRITLRSPEALSALARFHEALATNPTIDLRYRFSTTATVGREQGGNFPDGRPGIVAWEAVRRRELPPGGTTTFIDALKRIVAGSQRPPDLPSTIFSLLQSYVAETDESTLVDKLVRPFEWATGLSDPPRLLAQVHDLLAQGGNATAGEDVAHLADVLLMHVFRLLTTPGEKRLTVPVLEDLIRERSLTEIDRRVLTELTTQVERAQAYLTRMALQVDVISQGIGALQAMPAQLNELAGVVSNVRMHVVATALSVPDEPPVMTEALAHRPVLIRQLADAISESVWLSIEGATGMGKTYAARLLVDHAAAADVAWISLRGERLPAGIHRRIDLQLLRYVEDPQLVPRFLSGDLLFSHLAADAAGRLNLVVIDELPDLLKEPALVDRLLVLSRALSASGGRLVTTTTGAIPQRLVDELGEQIQRRVVPPLNSSEIEEVLIGAGTPAHLRQQSYLDMIVGVTHGHPLLVSAVIAFLRRKSWAIGSEDLVALITGDVARGVKIETVRNVTNLVATHEARELLYRLSLVGRDFDRDLVFEVARVPPEVPRAGEHLLELVGPWVNRLPDDRMEVSPLLSNAGYEALACFIHERARPGSWGARNRL